MKKLQVARFLIFAAILALAIKLEAATQDTAAYALGANPNGNIYSTGVISGTGPYKMNGTGTLRLAGTNTFNNGVRITSSSSSAILGLGYPPGGYTTALTSSGNSYIGTGRTIRFGSGGGAGTGGILELGCDMSAANLTLRASTGTIGATIRGYNQTSSYTILFSTFDSGNTAGGPFTVGAGATVIFGFPLPVGSGGSNFSSFNMGGTSINAGTLRLFNSASSSNAPININAYGILDCSLCTTARATALSSGTLTVAANGKIIFPSTSGTWTKAIA